MSYEDHYEWAKTELAKIEVNRQKVIQDLAARLDASGLPLEMIASEIAIHLEGYVSAQYVRRVLDKKYKLDSKDRTNEQKTGKPVSQIAVTNNGKNVTQPPAQPEIKKPNVPVVKDPPPEVPKDNPLEIENQFLQEENKELKEAMKQLQQFTPATNLPQEGKISLTDPNHLLENAVLTEETVFNWLRKRDDSSGKFWYDTYGIDLFKNKELAQLKNSGVKVFKRLYFEV